MTTPKPLPLHPSLESLRKQAKKLARDVAAGNAESIARAQAQLPNARLTNAGLSLSLRDAQLVLAREYGFAGWQDLNEEVQKRLGNGLDWAAARAQRTIHDNDIKGLAKLIADYPALLSWRDRGGVLLQSTTSYAMDCSDPEREQHFNRPDCAELLLDAGAAIDPQVWERVISTGAAGMLELLRRKGVLPRTLPVFAAIGDLAAVRLHLGETTDLATVNRTFMYACRFRHAAVASIVLDHCIALDDDLGRRIDRWRDRAAFVAYQCAHTHHLGPDVSAVMPWRSFVMHQLTTAMDENDLSAFEGWLSDEPNLLGDAYAALQIELLEHAAWQDRAAFITRLLQLGPSIRRRLAPLPSAAISYALAYGNAHLVPLLAPIWPLPGDLPHAAGIGDMAGVKRWFDDAGRQALGDIAQHFPVSHKEPGKDPGWGASDTQRILDTALGWACMNRQLEIAAFLLDHGADINTRWATHEPASILHECAMHANYDAAQFLIDRGIDVTIRDHRWNATAQGWAYNAAKDQKMTDILAAAEESRQPR